MNSSFNEYNLNNLCLKLIVANGVQNAVATTTSLSLAGQTNKTFGRVICVVWV
jgi:hypothetical protein